MFNKSGFTLIELSVALTVIAFLTIGVIGGSAMVQQARLRNIITAFRNFESAMSNFQLIYGALPGDYANANGIWAIATNGNGDGIISSTTTEAPGVWQQLALAGLIQGNYTGTYISGTLASPFYQNGVNIPSGSIQGSGYTIFNDPATTYSIAGKLRITLGSSRTLDSNYYKEILNAPDASTIDTKIDDGLPAYGRIMTIWGDSYTGNAIECVNTAAVTVASTAITYILTDPTVTCIVYYNLN